MRMMAAPHEVTGPINLGNPGEFTIRELAELVIELTGSQSQLAYEPLPTDDPTRRRPDITSGQRDPGLGADHRPARGPDPYDRALPRRAAMIAQMTDKDRRRAAAAEGQSLAQNTAYDRARPGPRTAEPQGREGSLVAQSAGRAADGGTEDAHGHPTHRLLHHLVAGDTEVQSEVLENLSLARNYRKWIVDLSRKWLGDAPLEIGSGMGDYAQAWAERGHVDHTVSEADPMRLGDLRRRFEGSTGVSVRELAVPIDEDGDYTGVVAINMIEHIEDDVAGTADVRPAHPSGGNVVLFVPAFPMAMSDFDREVGHFRRYRKQGLSDTLVADGLEPVVVHYVNSVGLFGWLLLVRLLKGRPRDGIALRILDGLVVPVLRRVEAKVRPPFGQSLFAVAKVPATPRVGSAR